MAKSHLFEKALISNRPIFVDYFLRRQYNVLETSDYIQFKKKTEENIRQVVTPLRATILSSSLDSKDDDKFQEDNTHVRAALGLKFVIEKLYANPIIYLKVL